MSDKPIDEVKPVSFARLLKMHPNEINALDAQTVANALRKARDALDTATEHGNSWLNPYIQVADDLAKRWKELPK